MHGRIDHPVWEQGKTVAGIVEDSFELEVKTASLGSEPCYGCCPDVANSHRRRCHELGLDLCTGRYSESGVVETCQERSYHS